MILTILGIVGSILAIVLAVLKQRKPWQEIENDKIDKEKQEAYDKVDEWVNR